jgi:hypothetical protein
MMIAGISNSGNTSSFAGSMEPGVFSLICAAKFANEPANMAA